MTGTASDPKFTAQGARLELTDAMIDKLIGALQAARQAYSATFNPSKEPAHESTA